VKFFDQIGIGQWFRYFTGIVEIASGTGGHSGRRCAR
jgi:hypothetical protein